MVKVLIGIGVEPPRSAPAVVQGLSVNDSDVKRQADVVTPKTRLAVCVIVCSRMYAQLSW